MAKIIVPKTIKLPDMGYSKNLAGRHFYARWRTKFYLVFWLFLLKFLLEAY